MQLELISFELGEDAGLVTFARQFRELFAERIGEDSQRDVCLKLYRKYAKIEKREDLKEGPYASEKEEHKKLARKKLYSMQAQVPPKELREFMAVWDEDAPRFCRECTRELSADALPEQFFCGAKCEHAGKKITCGRVVERMGAASSNEQPGEIVHRCDGTVTAVGGCYVCTKCGRGKKDAETCTKILDRVTQAQTKGEELTKLQTTLKRGAESLRIANNVLGFGTDADPDHVPAWTKRKRLG